MNTTYLNQKFERIGARIKFVERPRNRFMNFSALSLDIGSDRKGEYFEITSDKKSNSEIEVLNIQPRDRHLLLLVRQKDEKSKYLCGHDERHWFVAGIPESAPVGTVRQALEALKPKEVQQEQARKNVRKKNRNRRRNEAYVRQGEWFFIPVVNFKVNENLILNNEPLVRGGGKPHWAEFCYRTGGEIVFVCPNHPNGIGEAKYRKLIENNPYAKGWNWQQMTRNPEVYVRGHIRHPDHKTVILEGWHQVVMNTENHSRAMRNVAFLD